ncbi:hypothetical protein BD414DRAFT_206523 [Trametes punicea]|nr:hypothetical protein BD414DRAFT_206523 [Trametes punicea]
MASPHRLRPSAPRRSPSPLPQSDPVRETLSRLGLTEEQFKAKQAEMMEVLLRNQPFVPKDAPSNKRAAPTLSTALYEQMLAGSSSRYSRARSSSVSSSSSSRGPSPAPRTPARRDHSDVGSARPRDQMEMIIEQRNRVKEVQKRASSRQREETRINTTPTHNSTRPTTTNHPPETPHHYRYYSERVVSEASGSRRTSDQRGRPVTPSTGRGRGHFKVPPPPLGVPQTPSNRGRNSSCPPTPRSSPPPVVNLVSSPGPMRSAPLEEDECLPFTLPPGPYSPLKPELSYAAIIGQAILASPGHALALQDIYEYITTVYPYYKRGEPTWMNSVRHALSTMAVFRKVQRDRSEGKSLWAIWDCDLPCFEGGGFKKSLCADMNNASSARTSKKRGANETGGTRSKRKKTGEELVEEGDAQPTPIAAPAALLPPYFPPMPAANPYHQPYFLAACAQQQLPADVLFPPLPPSSNYHRVISRAGSVAAKRNPVSQQPVVATVSAGMNAVEEKEEIPTTSPIERPPSSSSVPELVPSVSASSSPTPSSHLSVADESSGDASPAVVLGSPNLDGPIEDPEAPWLYSDAPLPQADVSVAKSMRKDRGKGKATADGNTVKKRPQIMPALPPPPSPTVERRAANTIRYGFRTPKKRPTRASPTKSHKTSPGRFAEASFRKPSSANGKLPRPLTPPPMTASVEEIMRAMEQYAASDEISRSPSPLSEVEVATMVMSAYSDLDEASETHSDTEPPGSSSLPATPPRRLKDLESEIFDFSPFKSPETRHVPKNCLSPALIDDSHNVIPPVYNPRAPYLRPDNVDDPFSRKPGPSGLELTRAPPRTPKKTPPQRPGSSRADSPFGTPSRGLRNGFDDDFASFFQSPGSSSLFDAFLPSLSKSPVLYGLQSPGFGGQY